MSHLTASPFHKPSPFQYPQRSISEATVQAALPYPTPASIAGPDLHSSEYFETPPASVSPEAAGARLRRAASSIVYHNSGIRESRERTVQRSSRSFLVVLPPPSLPQDHGHLGNTLSAGPRHRLSQGLLMPLFPTLYGQLTAIAREYNFPSTTGLCLYLHYNENGITATPRISDDSWQVIWSHALDPAASTHGLPICGKIEFDIDMRLARWYGAWMASSHRELVDVPLAMSSAAPSIAHHREASRTTFADGDDQDNQSIARPPPRHVPRQLSLVDRFDVMSARSVPRSAVTRAPAPDQLPGSQNLSPIFQEDEPKTAKYDLEHKVRSWRASAILPEAAAIAEVGQILISGANLPNSPPLEDSPMVTNDEESPDEYRIEDYSFSISSAGPGDYDPYSPLTWHYDPSVHLANRVQGSVLMSPSTCTSFGPSDYTLPPYIPDLDLDRVYTPDIAHRMFEDVPPSPSIATSWGAPLSYPPSPISAYRAPSVHLADRQEFSRPVTPMTATSWGAPETFPPSPVTPFYVRTPDAGQRSFDDSLHHSPWSHVWPFNNIASAEQQRSERTPRSMQVAHQQLDQTSVVHDRSATTPWNMVGPPELDQAISPWNMVWPLHNQVAPSSAIPPVSSARSRKVARGVEISLANYSALKHLYPSSSTVDAVGPVTVRFPVVYPRFDLYLPGYPHNLSEIYPKADIPVRRGPIPIDLVQYASLRALYPGQGYPWNLDAIYPDATTRVQGPIVIDVSGYPALKSLYSAQGYPWNLYSIYLDVAASRDVRGPITVDLAEYAALRNLYPAQGYPWNLQAIYSDVIATRDAGPVIIDVDRYPALRSLYPGQGYPWNLDFIYLDIATPRDTRGPIVIDVDRYPALRSLYPGQGYPWNLDLIYLDIATPRDTRGPIVINLAEYLALKYLYPAQGYPWNLDAIYLNLSSARDQGPISIDVAGYPALKSLYPAQGYPWSLDNIYSSLVAPKNRGPVIIDLAGYIALESLYLAHGYPWNLDNIYASVIARPGKGPVVIDVEGYAALKSLYIAQGYPSSPGSVYAPVSSVSRSKGYASTPGLNGSIRIQPDLGYPHLIIYRAVFPHFDLYGDISVPSAAAPRMRRQSRFTSSDLHALVKKSTIKLKPRSPRKTHAELHTAVFLKGIDISTPSGTVQPKIQMPFETHLNLHHSVFPAGIDFSTPSGTSALKAVPMPASAPVSEPAPPPSTPPRTLRARSGSVLRMSLPPSPRPVGGRSPISRAPTIPIPPTPTDAPRASPVSTTPTRHSVSERIARSGSSLTRHSSMAQPPSSSVDETAKLNRSASASGPRGPMPRQRDSLVMQRVRAMQTHAEPPILEKEDDPLSSFPLPPRAQPSFRKVAS